jgi:subtilase family serine protease
MFLVSVALGGERQTLRGHVIKVIDDLGLQSEGELANSSNLDLVITLPLRDSETLTSLLQQQYAPGSSQYHRWLTPEEFTTRFGPTEDDYQAVMEFAKSNGLMVRGTHSNRTMVDIRGSVADIERVFGVRLLTYRHPTEARTFYAPDAEPSLDLDVPVLHIAGLDNFSLPRPLSVARPLDDTVVPTPEAGSGPSGSYVGQDFRSAYVNGLTLEGAGQVLALVEMNGYYADDIAEYELLAKLPNVRIQNVLIDGFSGNPTVAAEVTEVSLDIEMAISMAPKLAELLVYETAEGNLGGTYDLLNRIATDNLAKQVSSSWVIPDESSIDQVYLEYATQGQSFFQASGDQGAYTSSWPGPQQGADSPYITIVGGTTLKTGSGGAWQSEVVWNVNKGTGTAETNDASGGGPSLGLDAYAIPSWQQGVDMSSNGGSTVVRNSPDVAMVGDNVYVLSNNGRRELVRGTSCAAPLWAGYIALVNEQAVTNGQPTVGFINPAIYAIGTGTTYDACFHDITVGNNETHYSPDQFTAVRGYDLCTGWGTPAGTNLLNALAPTVEGILPPCAVTLGASSVTLPAKGGSKTVKVKTAADCTWTAVSNDPFITITDGASGTGSGTVRFSVAGNTHTEPVSGTIAIQNQTFMVAQAAGGCVFTVSPKDAKIKSSGGSATLKIKANFSDCEWTAVSNDSFITITSGTSGEGNGEVNYTVAANPSREPLIGSITVAGYVFVVTVDRQ